MTRDHTPDGGAMEPLSFREQYALDLAACEDDRRLLMELHQRTAEQILAGLIKHDDPRNDSYGRSAQEATAHALLAAHYAPWR